jgi:hypothetical protein
MVAVPSDLPKRTERWKRKGLAGPAISAGSVDHSSINKEAFIISNEYNTK